MDNRFTLKDFIFAFFLLLIIGAAVMAMAQFNYVNQQVIALSNQIKTLNEQQLAQTQLLQQIVQHGLRIQSGNGKTPSASQKDIRETLPDGTRYVCYPHPPLLPHNPYSRTNYARGDWLVENLGEQPRTLAPFVARDEGAAIVQGWVQESLLSRDPVTLKWEPWLARSYRISPNGLKITFKIRRRACFSNGQPVTAQDVLFSYNTMMNPGVDDAPQRVYLNDVKSCRAIGKRTVVFTFKQPYFKSLEVVGGISVLPESVYKFKKASEFNKRGRLLVGSGPYMYDKWTGGEIVLVRNPRYWGPLPTFNRIIYRFIQNPQAALQAFLAGQIDTDSPQPSQWIKYIKQPGFSKTHHCYKFLTPAAGYEFVCWNLKKPEFKDRLTRTALCMLVDRNAIIKTFLHGLAQPMTGPFNPLSPQNDPNIKPIPYDPAKAKVLLRRAGWKMGSDGILQRDGTPFKFQILLPSRNPLIQNICVYMKQQFAKAGIDMNVQPLEFSVMIEKIDNRQFSAFFLGWSGGIESDPYQIWDSACYADKGSNAGDFDNAQADKLISEGRREMNTAKRMAIWHKFQAIVYRQQPYMFLFTSEALMFINQRFDNTTPVGKFGPLEANWFVPLKLQKYQ